MCGIAGLIHRGGKASDIGSEMTSMLEDVLRKDERDPGTYRPLVAIGHSKDLEDFDTIERLLDWLRLRDVPVTTLESAYAKCCTDA